MENNFHRSSNPDFQIDIMDLQTEVGREPSTYAYYSDQLVEAKEERDTLLNKLTLREGQIELEERKKAQDSGLKLTEAYLAAIMKANQELLALKQEIVAVNKKVGVLTTCVTAMEHKKSMLSNAVSMAVTNTCGLRIIQRSSSNLEQEQNTQTLSKRLSSAQESIKEADNG